MFTIIANVECYCPVCIGKRDIIIAGDKILKITEPGLLKTLYNYAHVYDCSRLWAFPGIIDQHIHLIGGGGENGPISRIGEISFNEILMAGVTTVVGVLGFDSYTKSLQSLLAFAHKMESMGLTAYIYTGSYAIPTVTITGSIPNDLILIDNIIGTGEIAISDYRSSQPTFHEFAHLCAETHKAGLISGKAGVVHIHVGDGKNGLSPLTNLLDNTDLPKEIFVPTHVNRNPSLYSQAQEYCRMGGHIDLTAGETVGLAVPKALRLLLDSNIEPSNVTVSSDANGSSGSGVATINSLFEDVKKGVFEENIPLSQMFSFVTENVAKVLKLYPSKGAILEGSDADILITDQDLNIKHLLCKGKVSVNNGQVVGVMK